MNFKNAKIRILDLDLRGCVYLNHFSHSQRVATFFKVVSRLGDGSFWYAILAMVWITKGLPYGIQIVYLVLGSSIGTALYKFLKHKTTRPRPYQVHQVIVFGRASAGSFQLSIWAYLTRGHGNHLLRLCYACTRNAHAAVYLLWWRYLA